MTPTRVVEPYEFMHVRCAATASSIPTCPDGSFSAQYGNTVGGESCRPCWPTRGLTGPGEQIKLVVPRLDAFIVAGMPVETFIQTDRPTSGRWW